MMLALAAGLPRACDQAFVQRPGVHLTFPVVNDGVAEAERLALQVRNARGGPGSLGGFKGVGVRVGEERVDGGLQGFRGAQRVAVHGIDDLGVVLDHGLGSSLVDRAGGGWSSRGGGSGRGLGLRRGGLVLAFAATGEGDGNGQQTGGGQRHTNHGEFLHRRVEQTCRRPHAKKKLRHNAKDLHFM